MTDRDDGPRRFRLQLWPWLPACLLFGTGLASAVVVAVSLIDLFRFGLLPPGSWALARWASAAAVLNPVTVLGAWLGARRLVVRVGPAGLHSSDYWGRPAALPWDLPVTVRPARVCLVPYLRADAPGLPRPVYVPLRVGDPDGLLDAVRGHAGPDHPLAAALADRLPGEGGP